MAVEVDTGKLFAIRLAQLGNIFDQLTYLFDQLLLILVD